MAQLRGSPFSETIPGTPDADSINADGGNDTVYAGAGNDFVYSSYGDDVVYGQAGDDHLWDYEGGHNRLYGGMGRDTIRGGLFGNDLLDGGEDNDSLDGGQGNDTLQGGPGDDLMDGSGDVDMASYAGASAAVTVNLSLSGPQNTGGAGFDTLISIENLRGTDADDVLEGNVYSNRIEGSAGNDRLIGGNGGEDTLLGGVGDDVLDGSRFLTHDLLDGGPGVDTATYAAAFDGVVVNLAITGPQETGAAGVDKLVNVENLIGSIHNDRLTGNADANRLDGGPGTDTLDGGAGDDTYVLTDVHRIDPLLPRFAYDTISEAVGEGTDTVLVQRPGSTNITTSYTLPANIENGSIGSTYSFSLTGNELNNKLKGNSAANTINGGAGNDILLGGLDPDRLVGGLGADTFDFDRTSESPRGGRDTVVFSHAQHDKIDLRTIDADIDGTAGNQAFRFIGSAAFSGVDGQLRFAGGLLQGDTNGDRVADLEVRIVGALLAGDILL